MVRKRYEVRGMMEWHPVFRAGRTRLRVSFTGGHLCGGAATPACFETTDPVVQKVIESSAPFRSRLITVRHLGNAPTPRKEGSGSEENVRKAAAAPDRGGENEVNGKQPAVMAFDTIQGACDFLQDNKGVPVERLLTREQCFAEARKVGIELRIKEERRS